MALSCYYNVASGNLCRTVNSLDLARQNNEICTHKYANILLTECSVVQLFKYATRAQSILSDQSTNFFLSCHVSTVGMTDNQNVLSV